MKYIILISIALLSLSRFTHGQGFEDIEERVFFDSVYMSMLAYIDDPAFTDTLCNSSLQHAKKDLAKGIIAVDEYVGFYKSRSRYRTELDSLIRKFGMTPTYRGENCVPPAKGQTDWCYNYYMDKHIAANYGEDFKKVLHQMADSVFFAKNRNDTLSFLNCDERPQLLTNHSRLYGTDETIGAYSGIIIHYDNQEFIEALSLKQKEYFQINANLVLDEIGHVTDMRIATDRSIFSDLTLNQTLFERAIEVVHKDYSKWSPGTIKGTPVKTFYSLNIYFIPTLN